MKRTSIDPKMRYWFRLYVSTVTGEYEIHTTDQAVHDSTGQTMTHLATASPPITPAQSKKWARGILDDARFDGRSLEEIREMYTLLVSAKELSAAALAAVTA